MIARYARIEGARFYIWKKYKHLEKTRRSFYINHMLFCHLQAPTSHGDSRVWFSKRIPNLYSRSSHRITINCAVWGERGAFRVFLRTNLTHMGVIGKLQYLYGSLRSNLNISRHLP